jgi:hypothetical protein
VNMRRGLLHGGGGGKADTAPTGRAWSFSLVDIAVVRRLVGAEVQGFFGCLKAGRGFGRRHAGNKYTAASMGKARPDCDQSASLAAFGPTSYRRNLRHTDDSVTNR